MESSKKKKAKNKSKFFLRLSFAATFLLPFFLYHSNECLKDSNKIFWWWNDSRNFRRFRRRRRRKAVKISILQTKKKKIIKFIRRLSTNSQPVNKYNFPLSGLKKRQKFKDFSVCCARKKRRRKREESEVKMVEGQCTRMRVTSVRGGGGMKGATLGCNIRQRGESEAANLVEKFVRRNFNCFAFNGRNLSLET